MMIFNVRCCCTPEKILGTIGVPTGRYYPGDAVAVEIGKRQSASELLEAALSGRAVKKQTLSIEYVKLRIFRGYNFEAGRYVSELAVHSEDKPVEFWRQFSTFKEIVDGC